MPSKRVCASRAAGRCDLRTPARTTCRSGARSADPRPRSPRRCSGTACPGRTTGRRRAAMDAYATGEGRRGIALAPRRGQPGAVREELAHGDAGLGAVESGEVARHRIVEVHAPLVDEGHQRRRGQPLAGRRDGNDRPRDPCCRPCSGGRGRRLGRRAAPRREGRRRPPACAGSRRQRRTAWSPAPPRSRRPASRAGRRPRRPRDASRGGDYGGGAAIRPTSSGPTPPLGWRRRRGTPRSAGA